MTDGTVPNVDIVFDTPGGIYAVAARILIATFTFTGSVVVMLTFMVFEIAVIVVYIDGQGYRGNGNTVMGNIDNGRKSVSVSNAGCVVNIYLYRKVIRIAYTDT